MFQCKVCFKECSYSKLSTIGDQTVCSLSCVGLLKPNIKDSCNYCRRPVWRDNYYKIKNNFYCSEICRDLIIKQLNIPYNSKLIQYYQDDIFSNNEEKYVLKNSKQLREEVLKFYKDFKFDISYDENQNNKKYTIDTNNFRRVKTIKEEKRENNNLHIDIENSYENQNPKEFNANRQTSNNNGISSFTKVLTPFNFHKQERNKINNFSKNINKEKKTFNKINNHNSINSRDIGKKYKKEIQFLSRKNLSKNISNYNSINSDHNKNYSFINTRNNQKEKVNYNSVSRNNNNSVKKYSSFINLNNNKINQEKSKERKKECIYCGRKLGNAKILDRDNNAFCSDYCKDEFIKYNNK